ncbi:MAG TPA: DUF2868 domain-containing protein [Candidatus Aphodousia faecigallinarum]|uniref:DUF2868 domain-containing protein n=1 Tax=Candidatus Aphodousia faecigallinarum TaxID=2840677 RepID=A0A9D1LET4_9BURK|nr:DUF2868 domain-containing protein [Candidatus Aphodousia faecigallinarum]
MSEAYKTIHHGRFSLKDVETITQAKMLEETPTLSWESSDANRATRQAALAVGEDATISSFLVARARIVEKMIVAKNPSVKPIALNFTPPTWINALLIAFAFFLGLLTDQFASESSRINLLSLPFFGILLWNILVYVALFISTVRHQTFRDFLGMRSALTILEKTLTTKHIRLTKSLTSVLQPFVSHFVARAFHLAAFAFVLGMIASVLLRGIGTAYTVGWESTWFANNPNVVYQIIALTYGVFTNFLGPMPNILDVANMRFDRLAVNSVDISAGLWLMRMIFMLALFVAIPRLLLALKHSLQISKLQKDFPLDLSDRYYADILKTWRSEAMTLDLLISEHSDNPQNIESIYRFAEELGFNLSEVKTHHWNPETDEESLTLQAQGQSQQVWVLMNATTTPEHEVQGEALTRVKEKMKKTPVVVMVDMSSYLARFGDYADRIESRKQLWKNFCEGVGLPVVFYHSAVRPDQQTCDELKLAIGQVH